MNLFYLINFKQDTFIGERISLIVSFHLLLDYTFNVSTKQPPNRA